MPEIYDMDDIPSVDDYARGLLLLRPQMKEEHFRIFQAQYVYPNQTANATQIAEAAAIDGGHVVVNRLYGGLGHLFCDVVDFKPMLRPNSTHRWWAIWSIGHSTTDRGFLWEMRQEVAAALEQLGWVQSALIPHELYVSLFSLEVAESRKLSDDSRRQRLASASAKPALTQVTRVEFRRNPDVVAEVLARANGVCEGCGERAPFIRASDGTPYLEVHHVVMLADGGDDTVDNALGLCPNCHRKRHFG